MIATLDEPSEEALVEILVEPKNALIKQFHRLFQMESVEPEIRNDGLMLIARAALNARQVPGWLRSIVESIFVSST